MSENPGLENRNVLISGAGIAGPALAYWLERYGFVVTVVEEAPAPRKGGYIFGLDGRRGVAVLRRMGVWPRVEQEKYEGYDYIFVDSSNNVVARLDVAAMTKEVVGRALTYIRRADLARILYEHATGVEYLFGNSVRRITESERGVEVDFASGTKRQFDLVIGADGLHSGVRELAFGEEKLFQRYMGHYVAAFNVPHYPAEYGRVRFYTKPRRSVTLYDQKEGGTIAVFTFRRRQKLEYGPRDTERQKQLLAEAFVDGGWELPQLLDAMNHADDFFFDSVSQIRMDGWSRGRVALVGDAAYCPTLLTGYGSQLALVGAYVLAGELKVAGGDYRTAFAAYEREMRPFVEQKQRNIRLLRQVVPGSAAGLWIRNQAMRLMRFHFASRALAKATYGRVVGEEEISLRDYDAWPISAHSQDKRSVPRRDSPEEVGVSPQQVSLAARRANRKDSHAIGTYPDLRALTSDARARIGALLALLLVAALIILSSAVSGGSPDPGTVGDRGSAAAVDISILVFREGLESILVLAAITASMVGTSHVYRRPITVGVMLGIVASLVTWLVAVRILDSLSENVSALNLQAATGLLAIIVLLVVMNWFFHKLYWSGWISLHTKRKRSLLRDAVRESASRARVLGGLVLLGFTSFYREGFEVVLFLQTYRLKLGGGPVARGVALGSFLTAAVAVLTFIAQHHLPYRKMLVATGALLGVVLLVMVGEQAQEMQLAGWLSTTTVPSLSRVIPAWVQLWFAVFPTVETLVAQAVAASLVLGSYVIVNLQLRRSASIS